MNSEEEHRLFYVGITRAKNHLFLFLHHGGTRDDIKQFNKISRFVYVPNVLSKLEPKVLPEEKLERIASFQEIEKISSIYDKKSLLKEVLDFFR